MQITNKPSPIATPTPAPNAPAAEPAAAATPGAAPAASSPGASSTFSTAARPAVNLATANAAGAASSRGPLALDSQEAQSAIQKSVDFLQAANARGVAPGANVSSQLQAKEVFKDELGMTHVRMDRTFEGAKVFGEQVISHLDKDGKVAKVTGELPSIPKGLGSSPVKLSADDALNIAGKQFAGKTDRAPVIERVVMQDDKGVYRAAYQVQMTNTSALEGQERPRRMNYLVDANTGEMITKFDQMSGIELPQAQSAKGKGSVGDDTQTPPSTGGGTTTPPPAPTTDPTPAPAAGNDTTMYSGTVDLTTTKKDDGSYVLEDSTRGKGVNTYDAKNASRPSTKNPFTDANDAWGEASDAANTKAAVDAHYGAEMTYDFYKDVLGRDSIDGKGEALNSYVHVNKNYVNAFWDGTKMNYGDGDGKSASALTTLDIAGHEITHGLTERTAGLIYSGESGGLNEAMSDIMGTGVEWYAAQKNKAVEFDWKLGEDAWTPANGKDDALRYMNDPTKDGYSVDHYSNYPKQTEVHGSSGIANNAFYLLTEGGKNRTSGLGVDEGIGMDKSLKIFGRALTTYMTPKTTFAQARDATIQAATDLYGADSKEVQKVKDAWTAVGVGVTQ